MFLLITSAAELERTYGPYFYPAVIPDQLTPGQRDYIPRKDSVIDTQDEESVERALEENFANFAL